jgi:hypothetical protein
MLVVGHDITKDMSKYWQLSCEIIASPGPPMWTVHAVVL